MNATTNSSSKIRFDIRNQPSGDERLTAQCEAFFAQRGSNDSSGACVVFRELLVNFLKKKHADNVPMYIEVEEIADQRYVIRIGNLGGAHERDDEAPQETFATLGLSERSIVLIQSLIDSIRFGTNGTLLEIHVNTF